LCLQQSFVWSLISRRSRFQTGTRFFARGSDRNGNAANFCETEQVVEHEGKVASFVQTRGSMPFYWSQLPCIKYMPTPKVVGTDAENRAAMTAHFHEQSAFYGEQVIINLINQKKYEGVLEQAFRQLTSSLGQADVHYEAFDFHKECSKMRYDRLVLLKDQLSQYAFGYFQKTKGAVNLTQVRTKAIPARQYAFSTFSSQRGVFRTNCMDCLDRTNVVQAYLAADVLAKILSSWGVLNTDSVAELERNEAFLKVYRNSWADHANLISVQYAGTGALKTDFTRTGMRSHYGVLQVQLKLKLIIF
jgi:hypothetical protein